MTKVTIIDIDLNTNEIITEEVTALTGQTKALLDELRQEQLETAKLKQAITDAADLIKTKLSTAIQTLINAGSAGLPVSEIYTMLTPEVNTITITTKIKNQLKVEGNEWVLTKKRINKVDYYILLPYNQETPP